MLSGMRQPGSTSILTTSRGREWLSSDAKALPRGAMHSAGAVSAIIIWGITCMKQIESQRRTPPRAALPLSKLKRFGANPGRLKAKCYIPDDLASGTALVVALHGSQQSAEDYANGAGWAHYARQHGFALLLPEQRRSNNPSLSFNWFVANDNCRLGGEAQSIREMIETLVDKHSLDADRVFITGLSAGGAMAVVMMATSPELFAGGAVIAGLPYGCARGVLQAIDRMHGLGGPTAKAMEATIRNASADAQAWPTLSLWHGSADRTVSLKNVESILAQWRALHGLPSNPTREDMVDGYPRRVWSDPSGRDIVEAYSITGMGHGTPIDSAGEDGAGVSGAYMLDVHISSTRHIARFWGLAPLTSYSIEPPATLAGVHANGSDGSTGIASQQPSTAADRRPNDAEIKRRQKPDVDDLDQDALASSRNLMLPMLKAWQLQINIAGFALAAAVPWWWFANAPRAYGQHQSGFSR